MYTGIFNITYHRIEVYSLCCTMQLNAKVFSIFTVMQMRNLKAILSKMRRKVIKRKKRKQLMKKMWMKLRDQELPWKITRAVKRKNMHQKLLQHSTLQCTLAPQCHT